MEIQSRDQKVSEINEQDLPTDYTKSSATLKEMHSDARLGNIVHELFGVKNLKDGMAKMSKNNKLKIDTTSVLKIQHDGNTTFTLQAYRNEKVDSLFYNVVLNIDTKGNIEIFGLTYKLIERIEDGSFIYDGPLSAFPIKSEDLTAKMNCFQVTMDVCGYGGAYHYAGPNCTPSYIRSNTETICVNEGPGSGGNPSQNNGNGQGTYTGGGSNTSRTSPVNNNDDPDDYIVKKVKELDIKVNLLTSQEDFLIRNKMIGFVRDSEIYLLAKGNSSENKAFVREAVEIIKNKGEVDFKNEILKDRSFIGTKADCVLKKLLQQTGYYKEVMNAFTNNNSEYKIKFTVGNLSAQNYGGEGQTPGPDSNGIVVTTITPAASSGNPLDIASLLLHEGAHAQLHRILVTGNKTQYKLKSTEYNWLVELNEWWKDRSKYPKTTAQHDFMAVRYVQPIADNVRRYDEYAQPIKNYMYFGWEGLYDEGKNRGLIIKEEFDSLSKLAALPLRNDNHKTSCD